MCGNKRNITKERTAQLLNAFSHPVEWCCHLSIEDYSTFLLFSGVKNNVKKKPCLFVWPECGTVLNNCRFNIQNHSKGRRTRSTRWIRLATSVSVVQQTCVRQLMNFIPFSRALKTKELFISTSGKSVFVSLGSLSKHYGNGWRENHKTITLISKTMTVQVRYIFWYI